MSELLRETEKLEVTVLEHVEGDTFDFGGATVRVLAPASASPAQPRRRNDDSLVMTVSYQGTSALLESDAERQVERHVAESHPRADLLKVAHHGSATSTSPELLSAVQPRFAVISVGAWNSYGHPRMEVLTRLANARITTYRTDLNGAVTFYLDGKTVSSRPAVLH
jgi:competence protein ComEC